MPFCPRCKSLQAIFAIDYWIRTCLSGHPECQKKGMADFVPTRIVAVGESGDDHVRLVDNARHSNLTDKRDIALSHCWGLDMPSSAQTFDSNLAEHKQSIALAALTTTFVDVIEISRRLGIPYIWVDFLCIIQGNAADWGREAAQMSAVYTCAHITLAASGSSSGSHGCHILGDEVLYVDVPFNGGEFELGSKTQRQYRVCA
ncbi:heterokaryon incompatibility protein-domain-containing protein [Truncatella angustata]|uniref:Heterokaryon incompatibility protein-domain-containing protein n=1 Tax=Truncatella angustata TaxID=152316 RepID=A0A9P8ZZ10_9PEZI|nr:heterokaryon incompatibility protein-domain-containing protein [Truncatella angustata]KAH6656687.1 heterokaryon incompatibility protein-domain-containing protein [Truncatella angustata]